MTGRRRWWRPGRDAVDLGLRIEELERPKAEARKREGGERGREVRYTAGLISDEPKPSTWDRDGATNTVVGDALGLSGNTSGADVAVRDVVAGVVVPRGDVLPSLPAGQVAELRRAIEPYVDPAAVELVAAVAVGAVVLARQRRQGSSEAFLEAGRRRQAAGVVPTPPPSVWSWWRRGDGES